MMLFGSQPTDGPAYTPPLGNVLLLTCMDLRLLDNVLHFMNADNLVNRYDHVVFAGAALGVRQTRFPHWRQMFFDHLELAVQLHSIRDIYILEHRNCGAYRLFLELPQDYTNSPADQAREEHDHAAQAFALRDELLAFCEERQRSSDNPDAWKIGVLCFLMDLRGRVTHLEPPASPSGLS